MKLNRLIQLLPLALLMAGPSFAGDGPYTVTELCPTSPNSVGAGAILSLDGLVAEHPERATVIAGPANTFGALVYGSIAANPPMPWGSGSLCISPFHPGNGRYAVTFFTAAGSCEVLMDGSNTQAMFPFSPGETGHMQYLYRGVDGWNLTNALTITTFLAP